MNPDPPSLPDELRSILDHSPLGDALLTWMPPGEIPPPAHQLLVHDSDMTSALANFHADSIHLKIIRLQHLDSLYLREVTLHAAISQNIVEYGLIAIHLDAFPADLHPQITAGKTPLGAILNASQLPYHSQPQGFFSVPTTALKTIFSSSAIGGSCYGRYNHLVRDDHTILARILEILPDLP